MAIYILIEKGLSGGAAIASFYAAYLWWKASRVPIEQPSGSISDVPELHLLSTQVSYYEGSRLNARAAFWAGLAALFSTALFVGSLIGQARPEIKAPVATSRLLDSPNY